MTGFLPKFPAPDELTDPKILDIVRSGMHKTRPSAEHRINVLKQFGGTIAIKVSHEGALRQRAENLIAMRRVKQVEIAAGVIPGLRYLLYSTGQHRWVLRYRDPKSKGKTCLTIGSGSLAQAIAEAVKIKELIEVGQSPSEARISLENFFDYHYRPWAEKQLVSAADSVARFNKYIRPAIGHLVIADLKLPRLRKLISDLPDRLSPATKNRVAAVVKAVLRLAHETGFVDDNPARGLRLTKTQNARNRVATYAEIRAIFDSIKQEAQPSLPGLFVRFLFFTSARSGEVRKAKFDDLDGSRLILRKTKNGNDRVIELNDGAQLVIAELRKLRTCDYLFPGSGEKVMARPSAWWKRILMRAKVEGLTLHDARRSGLSIGVNAGVSMFDLATLAGHTNVQTTYDHYFRADDGALRRASELIQNGLPSY
jgi:integrase